MSAKNPPLPALRADRFELGNRIETLDFLLPLRNNRDPVESERDLSLWALEGVLSPHLLGSDGKPKKVLLASNIPDVKVNKGGTVKELSGEDITSMLASARLSRLSLEHPGLDVSAYEPTPLQPEDSEQPAYTKAVKTTGAGVVSIAFAQGAYREHFGAVTSAFMSGLRSPDLDAVIQLGPEPGLAAAA